MSLFYGQLALVSLYDLMNCGVSRCSLVGVQGVEGAVPPVLSPGVLRFEPPTGFCAVDNTKLMLTVNTELAHPVDRLADIRRNFNDFYR